MAFKDNAFLRKTTLNCSGQLIDVLKPKVMGILNVTPDSFYDGGNFTTDKKILKHVEQMLKEGADFIDIGGMSSRPGTNMISEKEETKRVIPAIELIKKNFAKTTISIDTFRSTVAKQAVQAGASIINDISGGNFDRAMFKTAAILKTPYILMHMKGMPHNMQKSPSYKDVVKNVVDFFISKVEKLHEHGVLDIIIDPGFGFGKTLVHNYQLLNQLDYLKILNLPIMVGVSRKSMINKVLKIKSQEALNGTTVLHTIALQKGANILRTHDVREAKEAIKITDYLGTV